MESSDSNRPGPGHRAARFLMVTGVIAVVLVLAGAVLNAGVVARSPASVWDVVDQIRDRTGSGVLGLGVILVLASPPLAMLVSAVEATTQSPRSRWIALATLTIFAFSILLAL